MFCVINRCLLFSSLVLLAVFHPIPLSFSMSALLFVSIVCCKCNSSFCLSIPHRLKYCAVSLSTWAKWLISPIYCLVILLSFSIFSLSVPGGFTVVAVALTCTSHLSLQHSCLFLSSPPHTFIFPFYSTSPLTQSISSQDVFLRNIHDPRSMKKGRVYVIKHLWACTCGVFHHLQRSGDTFTA